MSWTKDGRIAYLVKYARSPTRTHLLLEPMQFLARLAALVPAPRHPLVRYVGVLSSASKWRRHVVPHKHDERSCCHTKVNDATAPSTPDNGRPARTVGASSTAMAAPADKRDPPRPDGNLARGCVKAASNYIDWHTLLARVYDIDSLLCPRCAGQLRMISMLMEPEPIRAVLESMGLPSSPPVPARARYPALCTARGFAVLVDLRGLASSSTPVRRLAARISKIDTRRGWAATRPTKRLRRCSRAYCCWQGSQELAARVRPTRRSTSSGEEDEPQEPVEPPPEG